MSPAGEKDYSHVSISLDSEELYRGQIRRERGAQEPLRVPMFLPVPA